MTNGRSDFIVQLTRKDVTQIQLASRQLRIEDLNFIKNATVDEVATAYTLLALEQFFEERNVDLPFKVVLSE